MTEKEKCKNLILSLTDTQLLYVSHVLKMYPNISEMTETQINELFERK